MFENIKKLYDFAQISKYSVFLSISTKNRYRAGIKPFFIQFFLIYCGTVTKWYGKWPKLDHLLEKLYNFNILMIVQLNFNLGNFSKNELT